MAHFEKRLSSETKFEGRVITVTLDRVELENGGTSTREVVHHHGGAGIAALRETIAETTRLEVHPATDLLLEQQRPEEEPWLYLRAIASVFESFRGGKR